MRVLLTGYVKVWMFPLKKFVELAVGSKVMPGDLEGDGLLSAVYKLVEELGEAELKPYIALPGVKQCMLSPGHAVVVPSDYFLAERTFGQPAFGLRRTVMPSSADECDKVLKLVTPAPKSTEVMIEVLNKIREGKSK